MPRSSVRPAAKPARVIAVPFEAAETAIGALAPGVRIVGLTKGQFSLLDLLRAVLAQTGPAHVTLSTWTVGIRDAENARALLDNRTMLSFRLLVDFSFTTRAARYCDAIRKAFGDESITTCVTHAKFAVIHNDRWKITIRSSMNLNRNPRFEQFDLDEDATIADFFLEYAAELAAVTPPGLKTAWRNVAAPFEQALGGGVSDVYKLERPGHHGGDDEAIDMDKLLGLEPLDIAPAIEQPLQLNLL